MEIKKNEIKFKNDVRVHKTFSHPEKWVLTSKLFGFYHEPLIEFDADIEDISRYVYFKISERLIEIKNTIKDINEYTNFPF